MVAKKENPIFTLPPEMKARMVAGAADIEKARKALAVMKDLGMDVRELEEKLEWASKTRETLLEEFT